LLHTYLYGTLVNLSSGKCANHENKFQMCFIERAMKLRPVESSHLALVGHDPAAKVLQVGFHDGSQYAYQGVEAGTYQALVSAKSIGAYFNSHVKGKYKSVRLDQPPPKKQ
jgi:hypothetical protein